MLGAAPGVEGGMEGTQEFIYHEVDFENMAQLVPVVESLCLRVEDLEHKMQNMIRNAVSPSSSCYASESQEQIENLRAENDVLRSRNNMLEKLGGKVSGKLGRKKDTSKVLEASDHPKERFPCTQCGNSYENQKSLVRHVKYHEGTYTCTTCSKKYDRQENLTHHQEKRCMGRKRKGIPL